MSILLNIAGLTIDFDTRYPDYVVERCREYVVENHGDRFRGPRSTPEPVPMILRSTDDDILLANRDNVGLMEAELYAMTIPLSEQLPALGRLMTHGVAIECDHHGFIFTAESGVGKSTHAFLWQKYLGDGRVRVINGDKPILWFRDGGVYACGSPWSGKEHLDVNTSVPLHGICLLRRGTPDIKRATREQALDFLMHQIFLPQNPMNQIKTFQLLDQLYDKVPIYHLSVDMSKEAVMVSSNALLQQL